ncbi:MAG: thiosulfate oxidation carrier complex protein SoxZ [Hyphomonas sp.]
MSTIRISIPKTAIVGEIIEIKTLIQHPMKSGFGRDARGQVIPRDIIKFFQCDYIDETVFEAELFPSTAANPFISFFTRVTKSGTFTFTWTDMNGKKWVETRNISIAE